MESWNYQIWDGLRSSVSRPVTALFFLSWIFLGNFMLLNLFLAILLDSFTTESEAGHEDPLSEKELYT